MEILGSLWTGFATTLSPGNFLVVFLGVVIGTVIGVLPGLGPTASIALLLPATVGMDMIPSLIFLAGIYYGAMYGGSTTSILVNIPGEAASVITCIDGYQMARQGRAGAALGIAAFGSFIGGTLGVVAVMLISPFLAEAALKFGAPEMFASSPLPASAPWWANRSPGDFSWPPWACSWAWWERMISMAWTVSPSEPCTCATELA
jgi:putative tricarboxylic transport membrane protein